MACDLRHAPGRLDPPSHVGTNARCPSAPAWSPDGKRVVFACDEGDGTGPHLHEGRAGRRARRLALGVSSAFSPTGHRTASTWFSSRVTVTILWLAVWDRGAARVRLLGPGRDPCWGADSRHILFSTGESLDDAAHRNRSSSNHYGEFRPAERADVDQIIIRAVPRNTTGPSGGCARGFRRDGAD